MPHARLDTFTKPASAWLCSAALLGALAAPDASAAVSVTGQISMFPNPGTPLGPGDTDLPDVQLLLGGGRRQASFAADAGSQVTLAYFNFSGDGLTSSTALLTGAGTTMRLAAPGNTNRFGLGNVGRASMVVSDGAVLDGRYLRERCDSGSACQNVIGSSAGGQGSLTLTGAGTEAHFIRMFHVASMGYNGAAGQRGQDTFGLVNVLDGAHLSTELPVVGSGFTGPQVNGTETAFARVQVAGAGSRWDVLGSSFSGGASQLSMSLDRQSIVQLDVERGGLLQVAASPQGVQSKVELGIGGSFTGRVAGAGSQLRVEGDGSNGLVQIGAYGGQSTLIVSDGGLLWSRAALVQVGVGQGQGALRITGAGSRAELGTTRVTVGENDGPAGSGWLQVTQGAVLQAGRVEIARQAVLSGSGRVEALVVNNGTINPGDSPGVLTLAGGFVNLPGGQLVLEVADDGAGGFAIDQIDFGGSQAPDLSGAVIRFSFLGAANPAAFQSAGLFDIGNFLRRDGAAIPSALLGNATYAAFSDSYAFSNFSYSPQTGASFTVTAVVPEPGTWLLWCTALGAGALCRWRAARRLGSA